MIHPHTKLSFISPEIGYGVIATQFLPAGTITWVHDHLDRSFTDKEIDGLDELFRTNLETYCYRNHKGDYILCWDHGKYVNHSFKSNCLSTAYNFEIAIRDIEVGEQLTDDYGYLNVSEPFEPVDEGTARKIVYPDDLLNFHQDWDEQINKVFARIVEVQQPLQRIMKDSYWKLVESLIQSGRKPDSILVNYYDHRSGGGSNL